jgi:hypothetical protein
MIAITILYLFYKSGLSKIRQKDEPQKDLFIPTDGSHGFFTDNCIRATDVGDVKGINQSEHAPSFTITQSTVTPKRDPAIVQKGIVEDIEAHTSIL